MIEGFISKLKSKTTSDAKVDTSKLHVRAGEFVQEEVELLMSGDDSLIAMACVEIGMKTQDRKSVLVFASSVAHALKVAQMLTDVAGDGQVATVFGDTPSEERAQTLRRFKAGEIKFLVNVNVLSEGFDAPQVDAVCLMRPTMSPGLYYQQVGRGFRLAPGKTDCLVLDFAGNIFRHGPVDRLVIAGRGGHANGKPAEFKECPNCFEVMEAACEVCPDCGHKVERPKRELNHEGQASDKEVLAGPEDVAEIVYSKHEKRNNPENKPPSMKVEYFCGLMHTPTEYVCFEHKNFAGTKAASWWRQRSSEPIPTSIDQALEVIRTKGIREPRQVVLVSDKGYLKPEKYLDMKENLKPSVIHKDAEGFDIDLDKPSEGGIDFAAMLKRDEIGKPGVA